MSPELPPRNWISVDEHTTRLATDEEYAEYLSIVISKEGLVIVDAPSFVPIELPAHLKNLETK